MKNYSKTLMALEHKVNLSQVGACASCAAAEFHETKVYAKEAVAKHRAISREVRQDIAALLRTLDRYDRWVEEAHAQVVVLRFEVPDNAESNGAQHPTRTPGYRAGTELGD